MEKEIVVTIKGIGKEYVIGSKEKYLALRDVFTKVIKVPFNLLKGKRFRKKTKFWALKDINLEVERGDVIGIIGRNGAGKSTLLKILSRITDPTEGEITYKGRVASLLEVGTGFHPELTGRENVYLNGAILGMKKTEIDSKFKEIVEFSGVGEFIDMPVKKYSSGMQVRLAFSVAAHLDSDILIIDEVLAVGDAEFQKKCLGKMDDVTKDKKRTIFFVSHDLNAVQRLCKKTALLQEGKLVMFDDTAKVIQKYLSNVDLSPVQKYTKARNEGVDIKKVSVLDEKGNLNKILFNNESFSLEVEYEITRPMNGLQLSFVMESIFGTRVFTSISSDDGVYISEKVGIHKMKYTFPKTKDIFLSPGLYSINMGVGYANKKALILIDNIVVNIVEPLNLVTPKKSRKNDILIVDGKWE